MHQLCGKPTYWHDSNKAWQTDQRPDAWCGLAGTVATDSTTWDDSLAVPGKEDPFEVSMHDSRGPDHRAPARSLLDVEYRTKKLLVLGVDTGDYRVLTGKGGPL